LSPTLSILLFVDQFLAGGKAQNANGYQYIMRRGAVYPEAMADFIGFPEWRSTGIS
jgi:hypothetical protein